MSKQEIIERTIKAIKLLPQNKAEEISDFADFVFKRYEESQISEGIQKLTTESQAFNFLNDDEEVYTVADLKVVYNG